MRPPKRAFCEDFRSYSERGLLTLMDPRYPRRAKNMQLDTLARALIDTRQSRAVGKSRSTFAKKVTYLVDGVRSHSYFPIRFMSLLCFITAIAGFFYAELVSGLWFARGNPVQWSTPIVVLALVLGGTNMLMLGIVEEYVWRTLSQVRNRDPFIVEAVSGEIERCSIGARSQIQARSRADISEFFARVGNWKRLWNAPLTLK